MRRKVKGTNTARLIALNPPDPQSREFLLAKDQLSIGADEQNDIVVRDATVSRRHALLKRRRGNRWEISDLGSTNGTMVNGAKVKAPVEISFGDEIAVGRIALALVGPSAAAGIAAGTRKPARRRVASLRTMLEVSLLFFVVGFALSQYLSFLKYREENRFLLAQAEAIPAEQLAQRARLASQQRAAAPAPASSPPEISFTSPGAAPMPASPPPAVGASKSESSAVPAPPSSEGTSALSIPSISTRAHPSAAVGGGGKADTETTVGSTLAKWFRSSDARVGTMAPDFELSDIAGNRISLASLRGKVVLIDTWATWCHVCRSAMPEFENFYRDFRNSSKFVIITVSQDNDPDALRRFVETNNYDFPVLMDPSGQFGTEYDIHSVPSEILIGSTGQILWILVGGPDWSDSQIRSEFRKLL